MTSNNVSEKSITAFSIASLIFSILSLPACCTGVFALSAGALSILFLVFAHRKGQPLSTMNRVSLVLSIIGIVLGIAFLAFAIWGVLIPMYTDPDFYQEMNLLYQKTYGISLDELLGNQAPFNQ